MPTITRTLRIAALLAAAALAACASAPEDPNAWSAKLRESGWKPGASVDSIPQFRIDGFAVLDTRHVMLHTGVNRRHLITLRDTCSGLQFANRIGYSVSGGALTRFDKLVMVGPTAEMPCLIDSLQALEKISG